MLTGSAPPEPSRTPAELFSQGQLEAYAARLAPAHVVSANPRRGRPLMPRLDESAARLDAAYLFLLEAARHDPQPSEDWLRDNHHVVQDQVRGIRQHLPGAYYRELPKLATGPEEGFPRVYLLARELTAHTAGRVDLETVVDFVRAYQRTVTLSIGETWAVPIMLRLALLEQLRALADGVVWARRSRDTARALHVDWPAGRTVTPQRIDDVLRGGRAEDGRLSAAFVVELLQWLRDQPVTAAPLWRALHDALEAQGQTTDEILRLEHQREAADQLAIGNVITSMRLLSSIDWTKFFERVSVVERKLREDPAGAYARMDFLTRDRYRNAVEEIAKRAGLPEVAVADMAIALARAARDGGTDHDRPHHVTIGNISVVRRQHKARPFSDPSPPLHTPPTTQEHAGKELHEIQDRWKAAADAPRAQAQQLWHRYRQAADPIQIHVREFFAHRAEERKGNLERKLALIERAEAMAESTDWVKTAEEYKKLQAEWQSIGPVPRPETRETWKRFREACDRFFTRRNADLAQRKETWSANLAKTIGNISVVRRQHKARPFSDPSPPLHTPPTTHADLVLAVISAPDDPVTLDRWARLRGVSVSTLRARCYAAGVPPKKSLDLARLLRAFAHAPAERCAPIDLLDTKDLRTACSLLTRAGLSQPKGEGGWPTAGAFLDRQVLVTSSWAIAVLRRRLDGTP